MRGAAIGVRSTASSKFPFQLKVGAGSRVEGTDELLSPSVLGGRDARSGLVRTNKLEDDRVPLGSATAFPASAMPPLPFAPTSANGASDVTVGRGQVAALSPGSYNTLSDSGAIALNPGRTSFQK